MKFKDVLSETSFVKEAKNIIKTMIITLKAHNVSAIKIEQVVNELQDSGFDVDEQFVSDFLQDQNLVDSIEGDTINIDQTKSDMDYAAPDEEERAEKRRTQKALSAIKSSKKKDRKSAELAAKSRDE